MVILKTKLYFKALYKHMHTLYMLYVITLPVDFNITRFTMIITARLLHYFMTDLKLDMHIARSSQTLW